MMIKSDEQEFDNDEFSTNSQDFEELDDDHLEIVVNYAKQDFQPTGINTGKHYSVDNLLKVPETIWNHLYQFQKTGLKWLWELHKQRCGGILGKKTIRKLIQILF